MSVYRRMLGRGLPCSVGELLALDRCSMGASLGDARHEELRDRAERGQAVGAGLYWLGLSHAARGEIGLAKLRLSQSLEHCGDSLPSRTIPARLALADICEQLGQHARVAAEIDTVLAETAGGELPASLWHLSRRSLFCAAGLAYELANDTRAAANRYRQAADESPSDSVFPLSRLIAIHLSQGDGVEAILQLHKLLEQQPSDQAARVCLAHLLLAQGHPEQASWQYEQALCLDPDTWELPASVGRELESIGSDDDGAVTLLERLASAQPHFADLWVRLGRLYSERGQDQAARARFAKALALHPESLECHIALARHELAAAQHESAAGHLRRALDINEQHVELYVGLALSLRGTSRAVQSAEYLASAGRMSRNSAVLIAQLAAVEQDADAEVRDLAGTNLDWVNHRLEQNERTLAEHPAWVDVHLESAVLLELVGKTHESGQMLRQLLRDDPTCGRAWLRLGFVRLEGGDRAAARRAFASALALDPATCNVDYRISLAYCHELEFDLAMEQISDFHPSGPDVQRRVWQVIDAMNMSGPADRDPAVNQPLASV